MSVVMRLLGRMPADQLMRVALLLLLRMLVYPGF